MQDSREETFETNAMFPLLQKHPRTVAKQELKVNSFPAELRTSLSRRYAQTVFVTTACFRPTQTQNSALKRKRKKD